MKKYFLSISICLMVLGVAFEAAAKPMIFMPFKFGSSWYVVQGQGGSYSHHGNQYYAFDFNKHSNIRSTSNPAYNQPLYSPVDGKIVEVRNGIHDFQNNTSSNANNHWGWGNTIVIKDDHSNYYARLCHFKYGSTGHLHVGSYVRRGTYLGRVGQTGFSTSPHLHIQVMTSTRGASVDFRFVEGDLNAGDWVVSRLSTRVSALDNDYSKSLSNDFSYTSIGKYGFWGMYTSSYLTYTGSNYHKHRVSSSSDSAYFRWNFRVKTSGYYTIFAVVPKNYLNEPYAEYYFGSRKIRTVDQRYVGFLHVTTQYLRAGSYYTIKVKGKTRYKYLVADSLIFRRL